MGILIVLYYLIMNYHNFSLSPTGAVGGRGPVLYRCVIKRYAHFPLLLDSTARFRGCTLSAPMHRCLRAAGQRVGIGSWALYRQTSAAAALLGCEHHRAFSDGPSPQTPTRWHMFAVGAIAALSCGVAASVVASSDTVTGRHSNSGAVPSTAAPAALPGPEAPATSDMPVYTSAQASRVCDSMMRS